MRDFKILFSVLPGVVQHPQLKFEGVSSSFAELVIAQLKNITYKYMRNMETWNKEHPAFPQVSQFITSAFVSFTRAAYFYAVPLKNCIEVTANARSVFDPTQEYTVSSAASISNMACHACL